MNQSAKEINPNDALLISCDSLPWSQLVPDVDMKLLRCSEETGHWTALIRFQPRAVLPRHKHLGPSEFYVIKGRGKHPQTGEFKAGDYVYEHNGAVHDEFTVDEEVILYMTNYGPAAFLNTDDSVMFWVDTQSLRKMTSGVQAASA